MRRLIRVLSLSLLLLGLSAPAMAIPALQLGAGSGNWTYDATTQTWLTSDNPLNLLATANATNGNGAYAWQNAGAADQIAYLVISGHTNFDSFDVTVVNDGMTLSIAESGVGKPPLSDTNSLSPHGIFPSYYEIYEFNFDGAAGLISNTQPGGSGTGQGFSEFFDITINSNVGSEGLHFDLFTMKGDGTLANNRDVKKNAPYSHDAGTGGTPVPEPSAALVFSAGFLLLGSRIRRQRR